MRQEGAVEVPFVHYAIFELSMYHCIYDGAGTVKQGADHKDLLSNQGLVDCKASLCYCMICILGIYVQRRSMTIRRTKDDLHYLRLSPA